APRLPRRRRRRGGAAPRGRVPPVRCRRRAGDPGRRAGRAVADTARSTVAGATAHGADPRPGRLPHRHAAGGGLMARASTTAPPATTPAPLPADLTEALRRLKLA